MMVAMTERILAGGLAALTIDAPERCARRCRSEPRGRLTMRTIDDAHAELSGAAVELVAPAPAAPREPAVTTNPSTWLTLPLTDRSDAAETELGPQAESLASSGFGRRLSATQAGISSGK